MGRNRNRESVTLGEPTTPVRPQSPVPTVQSQGVPAPTSAPRSNTPSPKGRNLKRRKKGEKKNVAPTE